MSHITNNIMDRFSSKMATQKSSLPLNVQKSFVVNNELAKVVVAVPEIMQKRVNEGEVASSFDSMGMRYLPGSFVRCHPSDSSLFSALVSTKKQIIAGETASAAGLTEVASNVFTDSSDNVWQKIDDNGRTMFVCSAGDDVQTILDEYQSTSITTASVEVASTTGFIHGDGVVFYDTNNETASFGVAVDGKSVYIPDEDRIEEVEPIMVLASATGYAGAGTKTDVIEYMRKVYGQHAEFFNKLRGLIEANLAV